MKTVVCVFAKPPLEGQAKTRLASQLGAPAAAALARAFFDDTWARAQRLPWARVVLASTHDDPKAFGLEAVELWLQGEGDLGERMERVLRRALGEAPQVIALGADSPTLPVAVLETARSLLQRHDAVLGPAEDGGYTLLGLRRLPAGALSGLPWSAPDTLEATRTRLVSLGFSVGATEQGFDVDDAAGLARLAALLRAQPELAPRSAAALRALGLLHTP